VRLGVRGRAGRVQGFVQDLRGGLHRVDVAPARPVSGAAAQCLDVQVTQGVGDLAGDHGAVFGPQEPGGVGFGEWSKVGSGVEQFVEHGGLLVGGQGHQRGGRTV
jgi:hypothetical protein